MKKNLLITIITLLGLLAFLPAYSGQLNAEDIKTLFSGVTIESTHLKKDFESSVYYDPNGQFYGLRDDSIFQGKWSVKDDNTICITHINGKVFCLMIEKEDGIIYKYKIKDNGKKIRIYEYKSFTKGNPNNYKYTN